jgi:hypothetical protein
VVDENGIHLVDPTSKTLMQRPVATFDDPFPDLTCEDVIDAILLTISLPARVKWILREGLGLEGLDEVPSVVKVV